MVKVIDPVEKTKTARSRKRADYSKMTLSEYIGTQCRDRRSTLAYFKRCGLTWDKQGKPIVVPK